MTDSARSALLQGTLDMLILKSLVPGPSHGYDIARWIQATSSDALSVEEGSLYPALHRMERRGWIASEWGKSASNRKAKFYKLTRTGRTQFKQEVAAWKRLVDSISRVLNAHPSEA